MKIHLPFYLEMPVPKEEKKDSSGKQAKARQLKNKAEKLGARYGNSVGQIHGQGARGDPAGQ
jgi:hypothetical protein